MGDLADGQSIEVQGSAAKPYKLTNTGGVYSCSCPAWRNQSLAIERRTCKHLRKLRGDAVETARIGAAPAASTATPGVPGAPAPRARSEPKDGAPPLLLAHSFEQLEAPIDPTGWWLSEKLDGVRAWWDGATFTSRLGNRYLAPDWFTKDLPAFTLDGELWVGRKEFQRTISIVRRQDRSEHWRQVTFVVFDAPALDAPFEDRIEHCRSWFEQHAPAHARYLEHQPCQGLDHLRAELRRIEALGGEGLMLRQPTSRYEHGRSHTLLKVKSFHDAEARVIAHVPGAGKHVGRLGSLEVEMPDGTRFNVGSGFSDAERAEPPPIGALITYRYQELSQDGVPRFPTFVALREDLAWAGREDADATIPAAAAGKDEDENAGEDAGNYADDDAGADESDAAPTATAAARLAAPAAAPGSRASPSTTTGASIAAASAGAAASNASRRFIFVEGTASKFWEIAVADSQVTVRFGRLGSAGQTKTTRSDSAAAAAAHAQKLIGEKTAKGYRAEGA